MSGPQRPPRGPWGDVLDQVRDALDDAGVGAGQVRDELIRGVRDTLDALQPPPTATEPPDVSVVDGGRADDAPPSGSPPPDLRVAKPEAPPAVSVAVRRAATIARSDLSATGVFAVADGDTQTLFRAAAAHPYRVACDRGAVRVALDGAPSVTVAAGQTCDVTARVVSVRATTPGGAAGRYARLPA